MSAGHAGLPRLESVRIVLVRPAEPMNLGAAARAMKNCGLRRLTLVAPRARDWLTARRVAVHAQELLASAQVAESLAEAVAGAVWVVGTSSRARPGRSSSSPREIAAEAAVRARAGEVALVFGGEESGLSNADLVQCHDLSTIPSGREQPSFNLAQAVVIYAYELFQAFEAARDLPQAEPPILAAERDLQQVEAALRGLLEAHGFADPDRPGHGVRDLALTLRRAGLTPTEAGLWRAALARCGPEREDGGD